METNIGISVNKSNLWRFQFYFQGGVVLVSHDERLIRNVCNELWVVASKTVTSLEGGFDEYKNLVETELQEKGI